MVMKSDSARTKPVVKRVIAMMSTIISAARPSVSGLPKAGVFTPVATLIPIFIRPVPISRIVVPVTIGGKKRCSLPISGLQANCTRPPIISAVMAAARLTSLEIATIGPMKM